MAVGLGNTSQANGLAGTTITFSHTVAAGNGRALVVVTGGRNGANVSAVTYNGDALTKIGERDDGSTEVQIWYMLDPDVGTANIVVTKASGIDCDAGGINFTGALVSEASFTTAALNGTTHPLTIDTPHDEGYVIVVCAINEPGTMTYTGPGTQYFSQGSDPGYRAAYDDFSGGASVTHTWTSSNTRSSVLAGIEIYPGITLQTVTVTAKARIKIAGNDKTVTAKARLKNTMSQTLQAKGRIKIPNNTVTIQARAKIVLTQSQTIQAKANIFNTVDKTIQAKARIFIPDNTETVDVRARILVVQTGTLTAKARILVVQTKTVTAKARIFIPDNTATVTAKARIKQAGVTTTIQGMARILKVQTQTVTAKAKVWAARLGVTFGRRDDYAQPGYRSASNIQRGVRFVRNG